MKKLLLLLMVVFTIPSCTDQDQFLDSIATTEDEITDNSDNTDDSDNSDNSDDDNSDDREPPSGLKAFPTAFGAGAYATGGRGGRVIHVENLNDSGPGSLREAIMTNGSRIIVFDISGTIILRSPINNVPPNVTIAGQTAPLGGITLKGQYVTFPSNSIVRYLRFRQDRNDGGLSVSGVGVFSVDNFILDHCSISYGRDESLLVWDNASSRAGRHSIQNCIIAEGKTAVILGANPNDINRAGLAGDYSFYRNLISHMHRTPNISGNGRYEVINNVIYNWHIRLSSVYNDAQVNHIGNYYKPGPVTNQFVIEGSSIIGQYLNKVGDQDNGLAQFTGQIFTEENEYEGFEELNNNNWNAWYNFFSSSVRPDEATFRSFNRFPMLGRSIEPTSGSQAFSDVLSDVGANAYLDENGEKNIFLDENDERYISDAFSGADSFSVNQGNGLSHRWYANRPLLILNSPNLPTNVRPQDYDTDGDGMPNAWEIANQLDPLDASDGNDIRENGYTNIEEFLNQIDNK
ncbi:hypothetical protein GTQ40_04250 [Flavobacteriaceae bacterium R38]|nr:hypothetical protein [Flavobacteriaceae bacterium R38]